MANRRNISTTQPTRRTAAAFLLGAWLPGRELLAAPPFLLVVNPKNPVQQMEQSAVAQAFLKKTMAWRHGGSIRPVDLGADSQVRRRFTEQVLGRNLVAVKSYWQQMIFSGRALPPPELETDAEVVQYVLRHVGAIGYVSTGTDLRGARAVEIR
jgi:ABC-type phosphate transport system substrate-binding protein